MRGTGEGSSSQTQAWAVEYSALAKAVTSTSRSSADRVFRKITACKILSFSHSSLKEKKIVPNYDSFSFCSIYSSPPGSSLQIYFHLHIPLLFTSVIFLFFLLLCLNVFKQHSKWGTAAFAADAGPEGESINCSIAVLTFSSVLFLCSSWTI